jgi:PKD domain
VSIPLFLNTFATDLPNITGLVYANNRIYYTLAGDPNLYARSFTPESQVVGAVRYVVGGTVTALDPQQVAGMFLSGTTLYFADSSTGNLFKVSLTGGSVASPGTIAGPATLADSTIDWRSRGGFVWDGTPASRTNTPPTAVATASCAAATCTFDGSGSFDPDGHIVSYAWNFGDGTTGTGAIISHSYLTAGDYTATLTVTDFEAATDSATVPVHAVHSQYTAVGPCRVFDTRTGTGACTGSPVVAKAPVAAGKTLSVKVTGVAGVPTTATAVVLNVTAVNATAATFVTVYPAGGSLPLASNLNVSSSAPTPNLVVVPVGTGGVVNFYNAKGSVHLVADLAGFFSPTSPAFYSPVGPCRLFDTRIGTGVCAGAQTVASAPLGTARTMSALVRGVGGIPVDATAVVLNVTGVQASASTFVTVFPDGGTRPLASNLNLHTAGAVPNLVIVPIGSDGKIDLYNDKGNVNLIADVAGYFSPTSPAGYTPTGPCRVFDTRTGGGACVGSPTVPTAPLGIHGTLSVKVTGVGGVPSTATAVVLNVTAVNATTATFITVWPHGGPAPLASNLNVASPSPVPNLVVVPIGAGGMIDFYNDKGNVNLIADIAGYFSP